MDPKVPYRSCSFAAAAAAHSIVSSLACQLELPPYIINCDYLYAEAHNFKETQRQVPTINYEKLSLKDDFVCFAAANMRPLRGCFIAAGSYYTYKIAEGRLRVGSRGRSEKTQS